MKHTSPIFLLAASLVLACEAPETSAEADTDDYPQVIVEPIGQDSRVVMVGPDATFDDVATALGDVEMPKAFFQLIAGSCSAAAAWARFDAITDQDWHVYNRSRDPVWSNPYNTPLGADRALTYMCNDGSTPTCQQVLWSTGGYYLCAAQDWFVFVYLFEDDLQGGRPIINTSNRGRGWMSNGLVLSWI